MKTIDSRSTLHIGLTGWLTISFFSPLAADTVESSKTAEISWFFLGIGLLGGLALFLYGMEKMSDALKTVAGEKIKDGGRVPRQGRHVLDGTLDRMEGASLRGPETLPPWNLVFKWSDTSWYHSLGPGSFPPCTLIMERLGPANNPSTEGILA